MSVCAALELDLGDELVDVIPLELAPGATETRILDHTSAGGGTLVAKLDVSDALATDDVAVAVLPKRTPIPVTLVTGGNLFLQGVLDSIPLVDLQIVREPPSVAPAGGILVLDRNVPEQLPAGRLVVVDPQQACDAWALGEVIPQPIVASVASESPLTRHVHLENVLFPNARLLRFAAEAEPLIQDPLDQPLLARLRRPAGDAIVLTCSLDKGDLPLRIAFPVLMKNTIEWFQGNSGELRPAVATGRVLSVNVAAPTQVNPTGGASSRNTGSPDTDADIVVVESGTVRAKPDLELVSPSQQTIPLTAIDEKVTIGPLLETGLWTIRPAKPDKDVTPVNSTAASLTSTPEVGSDDSRTIRVACNLVDAAESDLRPRGELADVEGRALLSLGGQSLWFYLTLLAAGLIVTEWWLYQRRIVG